MRKKLNKYFILIVALAVFLTLFLMQFFIYRDFMNAAKRETIDTANIISKGLEIGGEDYLKKISEIYSEKRITIIAKDGRVVFDSNFDGNKMENHSSRVEFIEAMENGFGESSRISETLEKQTYYYALRMDDDSVLRVSITTQSIFQILGKLISILLLLGSIVFILISLISSYIIKKIFEPINNIDLMNPSDNVYDELMPFIYKIKRQNNIINEQILKAERKQKEFEVITCNMREGLIVVDSKSEVIIFNEMTSKILGVETEKIKNRNILELSRDLEFYNSIKSALKGVSNEHLFSKENKSFKAFINPIMECEKIIGATVIILDITDLADREKLRREFSSNVSHELKTPLMTILGYAQIMSNGMVKDLDKERFSEKIYQEAVRLTSLVNDIIMLSNLDEGGVNLERRDVDLFEIAQETINRLKDEASKRGITLNIKGYSSVVKGVPSILEQIVFNLVDNAIKYNVDNGRVDIGVYKNNKAVLTVEDSGPGIPRNERERVFERFYRLDKSRNCARGTGLGLSIVKHGLKLHDGEIIISDSALGGAKFMVEI